MLTQEEFSIRLKSALDQKKMKQTDLASAIGVSTANISNYMRGKAFPPIDTLVEIAKKLDVSLDWLCGVDETTNRIGELKTYGDVAKIILSIIKNKEISSTISTSHIKELRYYASYSSYCDNPYDEDDVPSIAFTGGPMRTFIEDIVKLQGMLAQGSLNDDFFNRWLNDRVKALDDVPIALSDWALATGDLPF